QAAGELSLQPARPILLKMLGEEEDDQFLSSVIWSLSQIGGEDVRTYLENLLDQIEDDDQIAFLEEALDNLAFTEDLDRFDLLAFDPEDELSEIDEDDDKYFSALRRSPPAPCSRYGVTAVFPWKTAGSETLLEHEKKQDKQENLDFSGLFLFKG